MPPSSQSHQIDNSYQSAFLISVGMAVTVALYGSAGIAVLRAVDEMGEPTDVSLLRPVLYGVAIVSQFMLAGLLGMMRKRNQKGEGSTAHKIRTGLLMRTMLQMAFAELPAILGLVLWILSHGPGDFLILATLSLCLIWQRWPVRKDWELAELQANQPGASGISPS